jgi:Glycosyl hydrolases family 39
MGAGHAAPSGHLPVYYTEWNSSSNPRDPRHDELYAAAFVAKTALEASDLVQGYSFWTFSDIFEENYFPSVPFHGDLACSICMASPSPRTVRSSCCAGLGPNGCWLTASMER